MPIEQKSEVGSQKSETTTSGNGIEPLVLNVNPTHICRSRFNRRAQVDEEFIQSVRAHGVIEPLITRLNGNAQYELIAGERRWRAALEAKLPTVPVIVRKASDREVIELQTIENDQREDLSPIEQAEKYQQLLDQYAKETPPITGEKAMNLLCEKVGRKKTTVYETLRLIKLPEPVKTAVSAGKLPASHATLIAKLDDAPEVQARIAKRVLLPKEHDDVEGGGKAGAESVLAFRELRYIVAEETKHTPARTAWLKAAAEWKAKGGAVMSEEEMEQVVDHQYGYVHLRGGWINGAEKTTDYTGCGQHPGTAYKTLMGKHAPAATLAHDREYKILELYPGKEARKAVVANGHKRKPRYSVSGGSASSVPDKDAETKKKEREARNKRMQVVGGKASELLLQAATKSKPKFPWSLFLEWLGDTAWTGLSATQIKGADKQPLARILGLLMQVMMVGAQGDSTGWDNYHDEWDEVFVALCKHYGIDLVKLEKAVAPAPVDPKPAAKVRASGKGGKKGTRKPVHYSLFSLSRSGPKRSAF